MPEDYFGYQPMLEINKGFNPSDNQLNILAEFMTSEPKRATAGYTYLGQFIDHDISLNSTGRILPWEKPEHSLQAFNERTPYLNLETIYDFKATDDSETRLLKENSHTLLNLGDTVEGSHIKKVFFNKDLPRKKNSATANILDSRNDENLAVAQTQVAFMRFHNAVVKYLITKGAKDEVGTFETARKIVIQHYQWIILKDYLPKIIKESVLNEVLTEGNRFYFPDSAKPFVPLEFSVAAFRTGHSMVRNFYNWNRIFNEDPFTTSSTRASIRKLSQFTGQGGMEGKNNLVSDWLINWNWFYDISNNDQRQKLNLAHPIDTKIASLLGLMPDSTGNFPPNDTFSKETSLPAFDLYRVRFVGLPSGQAVAKMLLGTDERILKPEQIANLLPPNLKYVFSKETPLWFYLLAEAEIEEQGRTLGEAGSRIVAETFVKLIKLSKPSILRNNFQPNPDFYDREIEKFGMPQMLKFIAKMEVDQGFDPLNPLEEAN